MLSSNMNILAYIGLESGSQLVPDPSRLIGSARSMDECIDICVSCSPAAPELCACGCSCSWPGRLRSIAPTFDVECWALDVWRSRGFSGTSFIPHFGQFPG